MEQGKWVCHNQVLLGQFVYIQTIALVTMGNDKADNQRRMKPASVLHGIWRSELHGED